MANGDTKTNQYLDIAANGSRADLPADSCCDTRTQSLIRGVAERIMDVEDEVERLENNPDVVDIVATYADLGDYDTSGLTDKDVIRVLQDETHNDDSTYYRWDATAQEWSYIGESKQYTDFVGTDGTAAGEAGLVPAPATTDAGKFLKADGTWDTAGSTINVVQTTGTSTTDVMSQNATTGMVFNDPANKRRIQIGFQSLSNALHSIAIGTDAQASANYSIALGYGTRARTNNSGAIAIGRNAQTAGANTIALGSNSNAQSAGEMNIGVPNALGTGYNGSDYRLLTGLHDPVNDHDGATKGYTDALVINYAGLYNAGAPTTSTKAYYLGQFYYDTTNDALYYCSAIDETTDPDNPVYTWTALSTGGSSVNVVQTTGTSTTDVMSQNAVTSMVFQDPTNRLKVQIGNGAVANPYADYPVAIGAQSRAQGSGSIALGVGAFASIRGELNIGTPYMPGYGYNNTNYRLITGVHDGQSAQDAVTVNQVNTVIDNLNSALNINIPHIGATS